MADFANGALVFVTGLAPRRQRLLAVVAVASVAALSGPFGTSGIEPAARSVFWFAILLLKWIEWELAFALLLPRTRHRAAVYAVGGAATLALLPFEIGLLLRLLVGGAADSHVWVALRGAALVAVAVMATEFAAHALVRSRPADAAARFPGTTLLLGEIAAIQSEDHYLRVHTADGRDRLIHGRFADALAVMAGVPGARLGRGCWLADAHRAAAVHRDRRWYVTIRPGAQFPVSRSAVAELRERGWLARVS